ncbi:MAG: FkbM family methyltransferase [Ignavibacteria bacterium]|nr:FkbM family methyltransferase [Ignavibacteria bacterium]
MYCIEPDRYAYESLLMNIRLNALNNVVPFHLALSDRDGLIRMASTGSLGDTMTSLLASQEGKQVLTVPCLSWGSFLECFAPEPITFMKIDIEGAESSCCSPAMKEYLVRNKPVLYLSTHAPFFSVEERRARLQSLRDILALYDGCLTSDMKHASTDVLFSRDVMDGYPALLFYDKATRPDLH